MPAPATRRARGPSSCAPRRATAHSPSPRGVDPPDGAGVEAPVEPLEVGDGGQCRRPGQAADCRGRVEQPGQGQGRGRRPAQYAAHPGGEMRDGREPDDVGLAGRRRPRAHRRQRRHHGFDQQPVLLGLFDRAAQTGGQGVVLLGSGAPAHGAGHRAGGDLVAPAADQQLGARPDEAAGGVGEARRVAAPEPVEHAAPVEGAPASTTSCRASTTLRTSPASMAVRIRRTDSVHSARPGSSRRASPLPASPTDAARWGRSGIPTVTVADLLRAPDIGASAGAVVVTQPLPSDRRITRRAGTTSIPGVRSPNGSAPTAIGPVPGPASPLTDGPSTVIDCSASATTSAARSNRPGPASTGSRAATPAVTNPAPPRSQANPSAPRTSRRSVTSPGARARVRLARWWRERGCQSPVPVPPWSLVDGRGVDRWTPRGPERRRGRRS